MTAMEAMVNEGEVVNWAGEMRAVDVGKKRTRSN
jgi:hypothetical protein